MNSEPKTIIVIGGGGHAKVVINAILSMCEYRIEGIVDKSLPQQNNVLGFFVLGSDLVLEQKERRQSVLAMGVGMQRTSPLREELFCRFKRLDYFFPVIRHATAVIATGVELKEGSQLMAGCIVQPDAVVGCNAILNTQAVVEHDCRIGDHAHIAPSAVLGGNVTVGERSLVGLGARILPGIKIGRDVTVGAGAVVTKDIPDGVTVYGVPAK